MDIGFLHRDITIENKEKRFVITDILNCIPVEMISVDGSEFMLYIVNDYWFYVKTNIETTTKYLTGNAPIEIIFENSNDIIILKEIIPCEIYRKSEHSYKDFILPFDFTYKWNNHNIRELEYILEHFDKKFQEIARKYL